MNEIAQPNAWAARMDGNDAVPTLTDRLELLRRRWVYPAIIAPACLLFAIFLAFALTPLYRSSSTIMLEPSSVPKDLAQIATTYADQQFELIQKRVLTTDNLVELVKKIDPYPTRPDLDIREKARMIAQSTWIERVDPVTLEVLQESNAFSIHYDNPDPKIANAVSTELVGFFLDYNRKAQRERANATYQFLSAKSSQVAAQIRELEAKLAQFKSKYGDALPEAQSRNLASLERARQSYDALQAQIRLAEEKEALLSLQLSETNPSLVGAVSDLRTDLATLRAELAEAEKKYTPEHPDVKRLRRAVQAALEQQAQNAAAGQRVRPDNPEYLRIASQLDSARRELAALRAAAARASEQAETYYRSLELTPDVERQYIQLSREHEVAQNQFLDIQNKLKDADLARSMVADEQGQRFVMIREPSFPTQPSSPNRVGIILLGLVLGVAFGIGAAMVVEMTDPTVRGARDLQELTGQSMIAAIPIMRNHFDQQRRRRRIGTAAVAFTVAVLIVGTTVVRALI